MTPMRGAPNPPTDSVRRIAIIVLSVLTVVAVPWVIINQFRDGGSGGPAMMSTTVQRGSAAAETTVGESPTTVHVGDSDVVQVALNPRWVQRGTSRYSETDAQRRERIRRQQLGAVAPSESAGRGDSTVDASEPTPQSGSVTTTVAPPKKSTTTAAAGTAPAATATPTTAPIPTTAVTVPEVDPVEPPVSIEPPPAVAPAMEVLSP